MAVACTVDPTGQSTLSGGGEVGGDTTGDQGESGPTPDGGEAGLPADATGHGGVKLDVGSGEPGDSSDGCQTIVAELLAAKHDDPEALVVLGLFDDGGLPGAICDSAGNQKYLDFVAAFGDRGILGSVCAPDYGPFFLDAVGDIDAACDEFEPEG